nr:hypothetical protein FVER53263_21125 [Fusarium verticillioides]
MVRLVDLAVAASFLLFSGPVVADVDGCVGNFQALRCMRPGPLPNPNDPKAQRQFFNTGYSSSCCGHGTAFTDSPDGAFCCTNRDIGHWHQFDSCCTASGKRDTVTFDET